MADESNQENGWGIQAYVIGFGTIAAELFLLVTLYEQASLRTPWSIHRVSTMIGLIAAIFWGAIPWLIVRKEFQKLRTMLLDRRTNPSTNAELIALRKSEMNMLLVSSFPFFIAVMAFQTLVNR